MFQDFPRKTSTWPATNLKPAGGAKSASYTLKLALVLSDEGVSITYVFFSWTKTTWFSCRAFNHMSPLSLPLYLTAAGAYFCRKQAEHFSAANMSNASARTQLGAQCQDCIARLLICMWPQITQAAWQDLKVLERWGSMHSAALHQSPALYQCTHRGKIHGVHAAVGFQVQGKNPLLCLIYFGHPCSEPFFPKALLLLVTSSWSSCICRRLSHCLKQEQTHRDLLLWKAAWVMFRCREAGGLAHVSWHTETRNTEFWLLQKSEGGFSMPEKGGDHSSELSLKKKKKSRALEALHKEARKSWEGHRTLRLRWWHLCQRWHLSYIPMRVYIMGPKLGGRCFSSSKGREDLIGSTWDFGLHFMNSALGQCPDRNRQCRKMGCHSSGDLGETTSLFLKLVLRLWLTASALAWSLSVGSTNPALTSQSNSTHVPGTHRNLSKIQLWSRSISLYNVTGKFLVWGHTEFQIQREDRTFKGTWVRAFDTTAAWPGSNSRPR